LGAGEMGEVYRARDTRLDRTVAVKILPADLSENDLAKQRFDREARAISSLNHPNICTLYDVGHQDGVDYLVMEFLEGETLADHLRKGPLTAEAHGLWIGQVGGSRIGTRIEFDDDVVRAIAESAVDDGRHDAGNVPIHVTGASGSEGSGRTQRYLCARRSAV
jgi:Protein kinase domain